MAGGCGSGGGSAGTGSTQVDSPETEAIEGLLFEFATSDAGYDPDLGAVEFVDCEPIGDTTYEGQPAFYCEYGNDETVASSCFASVGDRLYHSGGKIMCEDPFELVYG